MARTKELGMTALANTDHGVLSGLGWVIQFHEQCREAGIKPIIGLETYVVEDRFRKEAQSEERWHLTYQPETMTVIAICSSWGARFSRRLLLQAVRRLSIAESTLRVYSASVDARAVVSPGLCRMGRQRRPRPRWRDSPTSLAERTCT